jgi:predicted phage-related endonuclease
MTAEAEFWDLVEKDTPPAVDGLKATTEALKTIYANSKNDVVDLTAYKDSLLQYVSIGEQIKELEEMREEAANRVKEFMGESDGGEVDRFRVSWKSSTRSTFDRKRFAKENPDVDLSGYFKTTNTRTFRVSEITE